MSPAREAPHPETNRRAERRSLAEDPPLCNVCGVPLLTRPEAKIGVHISCVQETRNRRSSVLPQPLYGTRRNGIGHTEE